MNAKLSTAELAAVNKIIVEELDVQPSQITPESIFGKDLGADSLDMVQMSMELDEQFDLETSDSDIGVESSVG
ncbi:MAG TPA: acyl carrier protein [Verrucomicrobiae bacterium]|nr:acyl carrier protein [Verrucomicrobiae bacterium]